MPYSIEILGFKDPKSFVDLWSSKYFYKDENKYTKHIETVLDNRNSFHQLYQWKNGTGDNVSNKKMRTIDEFWNKIDVLRNLQANFDWNQFEIEFNPTKSSSIWKCFLLHLINNNQYPLFDQHVYRSFKFITNGVIEEIPNSHKRKYEIFRDDYCDWFNSIKKKYGLNSKKMDESLFSFGRMLKSIKKYPIEIVN